MAHVLLVYSLGWQVKLLLLRVTHVIRVGQLVNLGAWSMYLRWRLLPLIPCGLLCIHHYVVWHLLVTISSTSYTIAACILPMHSIPEIELLAVMLHWRWSPSEIDRDKVDDFTSNYLLLIVGCIWRHLLLSRLVFAKEVLVRILILILLHFEYLMIIISNFKLIYLN